ncbi:P27 family phage terminase small subunit [Mesorhizobium sp. IMUNJ 23232]|uniref:P27 family phage terminase small subunit n=1 Tax=Mesorhizobium sp. IMUNJ 23232 TaxID=3376064 RepID=UPI00378C8FF2
MRGYPVTRGPVSRLKVVAAPEPVTVPRHVPVIVRDVYVAAAKVLADQGRLDAGNTILLENYCAEMATARRAERAVQRQGSFFLKKGQRPQSHPGIQIAQESRRQCRMLASRLGLIPETRDASRAASGDFVAADDDEDFGDV